MGDYRAIESWLANLEADGGVELRAVGFAVLDRNPARVDRAVRAARARGVAWPRIADVVSVDVAEARDRI